MRKLSPKCAYGHPLDKDNTYIQESNGRRHCRKCQRRRARQTYLRKLAAK